MMSRTRSDFLVTRPGFTSYRRVTRTVRLPWRLLLTLLSLFVSVVYFSTRTMTRQVPTRQSWNATIEDLFPYLELERGGEERIAALLRKEQVIIVKDREMNLKDVLIKTPLAKRGKSRNKKKEKNEQETKNREEPKNSVDDTEKVEIPEVWPLPSLAGCPKEGVLTVEDGMGRLGSLMTQFAVLYALSRRDSKYAFLPVSVDLPLRHMFTEVGLPPLAKLKGCKILFQPIELDEYERLRRRNGSDFRTNSYLLKRGPNRAKLYHKYKEDLMTYFQPQPSYTEKSETVLKQYWRTGTEVVVGIFMEADDFEYMKQQLSKSWSDYVGEAVSYFINMYTNPVFVVRCSSPAWCDQVLTPHLKKYLLGPGQTLTDVNIYFPDKDSVWKYVEDFSLISSCNHSVVLRSHMSWWMSYCSQGSAVIPDMESSILGNVRSLRLPWQVLTF